MNVDRRVILDQIGFWNVGAISGGRVQASENGVILPVGYGYKVAVELAGDDTYTVKRVYQKAALIKEWVVEGVYNDNVGEVAYQASLFRSNKEFGQKVLA